MGEWLRATSWRSRRGRSRPVHGALAILLAAGLLGVLCPPVSGDPQLRRSTFCRNGTIGKDPNAAFQVRLVVSSRSTSTGRAVRIRLENTGSVDAAYGYPYRLQRRQGKGWVSQPVPPFFSARLSVRSGHAGICQTVQTRESSAPGLYRVSKLVWPAEAKSERPKVLVRATFRVLGGSR